MNNQHQEFFKNTAEVYPVMGDSHIVSSAHTIHRAVKPNLNFSLTKPTGTKWHQQNSPAICPRSCSSLSLLRCLWALESCSLCSGLASMCDNRFCKYCNPSDERQAGLLGCSDEGVVSISSFALSRFRPWLTPKPHLWVTPCAILD